MWDTTVRLKTIEMGLDMMKEKIYFGIEYDGICYFKSLLCFCNKIDKQQRQSKSKKEPVN